MDSGSILNWVIFDDIFTRNGKKHLVVEWLSWLLCKRDFINSTILENQEDLPNTLPSLKLLEQRVHGLVEGVHSTTLLGPKGLDQEGFINWELYKVDYLIKLSQYFGNFAKEIRRSHNKILFSKVSKILSRLKVEMLQWFIC